MSAPRLLGIVSSFREGPLLVSAVSSALEACQYVYVLEGPAGRPEPDIGEESDLATIRGNRRVLVERAERFPDEAAKRNYMLERVRERFPKLGWALYLDADEVLVDGRYLPDLVWAAMHASESQVGSIPLLVTEADGSVGKIHRVFSLALLERHVLSMSQFRFAGASAVVTLPLIPVWRPGEDVTAFARPPLAGEPHLHHRAYYRPPRRLEHRLHKLEGDDFRQLEQEALAEIGVTPLWVPGKAPA
jgi:hypothetical protein